MKQKTLLSESCSNSKANENEFADAERRQWLTNLVRGESVVKKPPRPAIRKYFADVSKSACLGRDRALQAAYMYSVRESNEDGEMSPPSDGSQGSLEGVLLELHHLSALWRNYPQKDSSVVKEQVPANRILELADPNPHGLHPCSWMHASYHNGVRNWSANSNRSRRADATELIISRRKRLARRYAMADGVDLPDALGTDRSKQRLEPITLPRRHASRLLSPAIDGFVSPGRPQSATEKHVNRMNPQSRAVELGNMLRKKRRPSTATTMARLVERHPKDRLIQERVVTHGHSSAALLPSRSFPLIDRNREGKGAAYARRLGTKRYNSGVTSTIVQHTAIANSCALSQTGKGFVVK